MAWAAVANRLRPLHDGTLAPLEIPSVAATWGIAKSIDTRVND